MFSKKRPPLIGVDISSTAVKLLELSGSGGNYRARTAAIEWLPPNAVVEKDIKHVEVVGDVIRQCFRKARPSSKLVACAVGGSATITKIIQMPLGLSEDEMEAQIESEADKHVPYPIEDVNLHFEVLGHSPQDPNMCDVLLAVCRMENVDRYVEAFNLAGLSAAVVDVEAYAIGKAFELVRHQLPGGGAGLTAIIDIGAHMMTLSVLRDHEVIFAREQLAGGQELSESIQRQYNLSYDEAEVAKQQGGLPQDYAQSLLQPFNETMVQHIKRALQIFFSQSHHTEVSQVVLSGGCSALAGLAQATESGLGMPVMVANPFSAVKSSGAVANLLGQNPGSWMCAAGLALRSFD